MTRGKVSEDSGKTRSRCRRGSGGNPSGSVGEFRDAGQSAQSDECGRSEEPGEPHESGRVWRDVSASAVKEPIVIDKGSASLLTFHSEE